MSGLARTISTWFWNEDIWLPPGYHWESFNSPQLTNNKTVRVEPGEFARFSDLLYPIPLALVLILTRLLLQRTVFRPLATRLGLKSRTRPCHLHNEKLEAVFRRRSSLSRQDMAELSAESGLSAIQVRQYFCSSLSKYLSRSSGGSGTGGGLTSQTQHRNSVRRHSGL